MSIRGAFLYFRESFDPGCSCTIGQAEGWLLEGVRLFGQQWNPPGLPTVYTGTSSAICLLEILVHPNRKSPPSSSRFVEAVVPDEVSREEFDPFSHPGWDNPHDMAVAQAFGRDWIQARRAALLIVPSVVTGGSDLNVVVNPDHPESCGFRWGLKEQ
jgi:RES domain-containing protein